MLIMLELKFKNLIKKSHSLNSEGKIIHFYIRAYFLKFIYLFLGRRGRERETENIKQAQCCLHRAQSGAQTDEP